MNIKFFQSKATWVSLQNRYVFIVIIFLALPLYLNAGSTKMPDTEIDIPTQSDWIDYGTIFEAGAVGAWDHLLWGGFANSTARNMTRA
jgi:hypothetical protein